MIIKNDYFEDHFYDIRHEQILASIVVMLTWTKVFYYMKLFRTPAFFINLLTETFADDNFRAFCLMTIVLVVTFANVFYIMNQERGSDFIV